MRTDIKHTPSRGVQLPTSHSDLSSHDIDIVGGSPTKPHVYRCDAAIRQPYFWLHGRRKPVQEFIQRTATIPIEGYPDRSDSDSHDNRRPHDERRYSGRRRQYYD